MMLKSLPTEEDKMSSRNDSCSQSTPSLSICSLNMFHFSYIFRSISNHSVSMTKAIMQDPLSRLACIFLIIAEKKGKSPHQRANATYSIIIGNILKSLYTQRALEHKMQFIHDNRKITENTKTALFRRN